MDSILKPHVHQLIDDSEKAKKVLEMLEKDFTLWMKKGDEKYLKMCIMHTKQLECDISMIMEDCFCTGYRQNDSQAPIEDLCLAFARLNDLFEGFIKASLKFNPLYIFPGEF